MTFAAELIAIVITAGVAALGGLVVGSRIASRKVRARLRSRRRGRRAPESGGAPPPSPSPEYIALNVINAMKDGVAIIGADGTYVEANPALCRMTGFSREELVGSRPPYPYWAPEHVEALMDSMMQAVRGEVDQFEAIFQRKDGKRFHAVVNPSTFSEGDNQYYLSTFKDVSDKKRAEAHLRDTEQRYKLLYDNTPMLFYSVDANGIVLSVNRFGAEHLGFTPEELIGQSFTKFVPEHDHAAARGRFFECVESPGSIHRSETAKQRRDGAILQVKETLRAVAEPDDHVIVQAMCEDVTEARHLVEQIAYDATHDAVTRLANRWEFERMLKKALETSTTGAEHALFYIDIDQFELVNDSAGHVAGDLVLRQLAERLSTRYGESGLARLGGDEFGLLIQNCPPTKAQTVARELRDLINNMRLGSGNERVRITASIGIVPINAQHTTPEQVLQAADVACNMAKDLGRDRTYTHSPEDKLQLKRRGEMQWAVRVRRALDEKRLRLVTQQIVPVSGPSRGKHYEVLIRMIDEKGEMLPSANFMIAAERYGLSTQIDMWTVNTIFDWLGQRQVHTHNLHMCTINLSGHSLGNQEFHQFLMQKCLQGRVPLEKLCFEVTETAAITNLAQATRLMRTLRRTGVHFALDDFGSGLSSFAYLKDLPVDFLKIDGAFVRGIDQEPMALAVLKAINDLGHLLGKQTIAEFVENDAVLEKLREIGVDYAQGFGVAKPQPLEKIA